MMMSYVQTRWQLWRILLSKHGVYCAQCTCLYCHLSLIPFQKCDNLINNKNAFFVKALLRAIFRTGWEEVIRNKQLENWMWLVKFLWPFVKWFSLSDGLDNFTAFSTRLRCENQFRYQMKMSLNSDKKLKCHVEENGSAAMLAAMRSAGITPEVNVTYASTKCK